MEERIWKTQNEYFATTNPGIYTGDRDSELLFFGQREGYWSINRRYEEFDSIQYLFGTYYMHYVLSGRTGGVEEYYPFPFELLDEDASVSIGQLEFWCLQDRRTSHPISEFRTFGEENTMQHGGWAKEDIRYWEPNDRIRLLKPFVYTKCKIGDTGAPWKFFTCGKKQHSIHMDNTKFWTDAAKGIIPEILYEKEFS